MTTAEDQRAAEPSGRRWRGRWIALALLLALTATWLAVALSAQPLRSGGYAAFRNYDRPVTRISPPSGDTFYLAEWVPGERYTIGFGLLKEGWLPVRVTEVWPVDHPMCAWQPQTWSLRHIYSLDAPARDFAPFPLDRNMPVVVELAGALHDLGGCRYAGGMGVHDDVVVRARVLGLPRTFRVALPYEFGYSEEPELFLDDLLEEVPVSTDP